MHHLFARRAAYAILPISCAVVGREADAQPQAARVFAGAPAASWIAPPGIPGDSSIVFHTRRTFDLAAKPARFVVHVSADNRYRLYVNGEEVSSGPQRSDVMHWRYETVDVAPQLRAGRNVVAALVWNWGAARPVAQHSNRTGFLLQGDSEREAVINSGPGWQLRVDSAYRFVRLGFGEIRGYYAASPGEAMDGALYPWGWEASDYDDAAWFTVPAAAQRTEGGPPAGPPGAGQGGAIVGRVLLRGAPGGGEVAGWLLMPRNIPPMEEKAQRFARVRRVEGVTAGDEFVRGAGSFVVPAHSKASVLLDQSRTTNAYPVLETSGGKGGTITLTYAEALFDAQGRKGNRNEVEGRTIRGVRDVIRPDGGAHRRSQSLFWRSYRYVQMDVETADEPVTVHDLHGIFTAYPFQERGRFTSDLAWIDSVWAMDWNGARLGAHETYMDTPYYEQLQYVGDTRIQGLISLYVAGDDRLVRQAIEHFDMSRIADGITTSRYPSELTQLIPPFSLIHVAMVHDYYMHRDDAAFVRQRLAGIRAILDWYGRHVDSTGMLGPMPYWNYVDWSPRWPRGVPPRANDGHSATISLLYAYALQRAAELESGVGAPGLGAQYRARADSVIRAVRARTWDGNRRFFRDAPDTSVFSQHTNVLALLTGAVPQADRRALMERVLADTTLAQATYYFGFYVFEALRESGLSDRYVERLAPWRQMLALGLTSTPENPEPTRSDTHAWAAHPNYGLLATVLGVRPASPGFRTVRIAPALGVLKRAEGRVAHPAGDIDVMLERVGAAGVHGVVTLPAGVTGAFEWAGKRVPLRAGRQEVRL
ncbi:MAG: alpha-L-rhamnosidase N-terminal domain-containing protein [Gemmatimonadaceae bacterium]